MDRFLTQLPKHLTTAASCNVEGQGARCRCDPGKGNLWSRLHPLKRCPSLLLAAPFNNQLTCALPSGSPFSLSCLLCADLYMNPSSSKHNIVHSYTSARLGKLHSKRILTAFLAFNIEVPPNTSPPFQPPSPEVPCFNLKRSTAGWWRVGCSEKNRGKDTDEEPFWYTAAGKGSENWLNLDENYIKGSIHLLRWTCCMRRAERSPVQMYDLCSTVILS